MTLNSSLVLPDLALVEVLLVNLVLLQAMQLLLLLGENQHFSTLG